MTEPALGENRAVYSPGDIVRVKGDTSHSRGTVLLANSSYEKALVRWDDVEQQNQTDQWADFVQLEKLFPAGIEYSTGTAGPNAVVSTAGMHYSEPNGLSLDQAQQRRNRILAGRSPIEFQPLNLAWSEEARLAAIASRRAHSHKWAGKGQVLGHIELAKKGHGRVHLDEARAFSPADHPVQGHLRAAQGATNDNELHKHLVAAHASIGGEATRDDIDRAHESALDESAHRARLRPAQEPENKSWLRRRFHASDPDGIDLSWSEEARIAARAARRAHVGHDTRKIGQGDFVEHVPTGARGIASTYHGYKGEPHVHMRERSGPGSVAGHVSEFKLIKANDEFKRPKSSALDAVKRLTADEYQSEPEGAPSQLPPNLREASGDGDPQFLTQQMCSSCKWWDPGDGPDDPFDTDLINGQCTQFNYPTMAEQVCSSWMGRGGYDMAIVIEESPLLALDEGGTPTRFRKVSLRTGIVAAATPGNDGSMASRPLEFVDGRSVRNTDGSFSKIGFDDIIDSITDPAFEKITVPESHADRVAENTGYVTGYRKLDDPNTPGQKVLELEHEITEPAIAEKIQRGSIYGSSVGLLFDYVRKTDLKKFPVALKHNALTNVPWVRGLGAHSVAASEGEEAFEPITSVGGIAVAHVEVMQNAGSSKEGLKSGANAADEHNKEEGGEHMDEAQTATQAEMQLQLSEQSDLVRQQQEELNRLHVDLHRRNVDDTITGWSGKGLDRLPGFLAKARQFMLADDGGPALVLNLSEEEGGGKQELTATGVIEGLVASLPFDEKAGKLQLGQQAFAPDTVAADQARPPVKAPGEGFDNTSDAVKDRAEELRKEMGLVSGIPGGGDN